MSNGPRATITKRQRELDQKDRVKAREARRVERRERSAARAAAGHVGPPMGEPRPSLGDYTADDHARKPGEGVDAAPSPARPQATARLYVGNLAYETTAEVLRDVFTEYGEVKDVMVMVDRDTGRPRGFAFVSMVSVAAAEKAIAEADGQVVDGRNLRVNMAEDRRSGPPQRGRY